GALVGALLRGRPELAVVGTPFVLFLVVGLAAAPDPAYRVRVTLDNESVVQGERAEMRVDVECVRAGYGAAAHVALPGGLHGEPSNTISFRVEAGGHRLVTVPVRCSRWGAYVLGNVSVRAGDRLGLFTYEQRSSDRVALKVYPRSESLRTLPRPARTLPFFGSLVSRERGEGLELAEVRPFAPGDRIRSINWRATARRGGIWVTDRHPERNADVVVFLDAFTELSVGERNTLDVAVRAAASISEALLAGRDRVGLVSFGG